MSTRIPGAVRPISRVLCSLKVAVFRLAGYVDLRARQREYGYKGSTLLQSAFLELQWLSCICEPAKMDFISSVDMEIEVQGHRNGYLREHVHERFIFLEIVRPAITVSDPANREVP